MCNILCDAYAMFTSSDQFFTQDPVELDDSMLTYIDTEDALKKMIKSITRESEIAVDLEVIIV